MRVVPEAAATRFSDVRDPLPPPVDCPDAGTSARASGPAGAE
jgi:hypothetical protein